MRSAFYIVITLFSLCVLFGSCRKDGDGKEITRSTTEITISKNQLYELNLGSACDECGYSISRQATNFTISRIIRDTTYPDFNIYHYQPSLNFVGTDEIEIVFASGSDGTSPPNKFHYRTLKFTIVN